MDARRFRRLHDKGGQVIGAGAQDRIFPGHYRRELSLVRHIDINQIDTVGHAETVQPVKVAVADRHLIVPGSHQEFRDHRADLARAQQ
jgi:hypothetical protein